MIEIRLITSSGSTWPDRPRPWVARITGTDPKYGLAREFVKAVYDYSRASKRGKNTYVYYNLAPGIYEVWHPVSWRHETRYFARVDDDGEVYEIGHDEVMQWLESDT